MKDEELLDEVEDLLRTSPPQAAFKEQENDEALRWLGRTKAILTEWNFTQTVWISLYSKRLLAEGISQTLNPFGPAYRGIRTLLFQAQQDLQMKTRGPRTVAIPERMPFDYFDEIRKITETAREDLLFVDPYLLDAEFVSRYLRPVTSGVVVRLLTSKKLASLLPAVETLVTQTGLRVEVRSAASGLHARYVFVDEARCYQSGASFKDGAKQSQTTLTQITDAFETMFQTYQRMWGNAKVERDLGSGPV